MMDVMVNPGEVMSETSAPAQTPKQPPATETAPAPQSQSAMVLPSSPTADGFVTGGFTPQPVETPAPVAPVAPAPVAVAKAPAPAPAQTEGVIKPTFIPPING